MCDLAWVAERSENLVSHHLRVLRGAGLVRSRRDGKMVMYAVTEAGRALIDAVRGPEGQRDDGTTDGHVAGAGPVRGSIARPTERLARRARLLSWLSLAWMTVEGAVAITAGLVASSIALVGFGLDSAIEGFASLVIVWRFTGSRMFSHVAETRAQKLVAVQFFLLAPYVAVESMRALIGGERPAETWVGIALAVEQRRC